MEGLRLSMVGGHCTRRSRYHRTENPDGVVHCLSTPVRSVHHTETIDDHRLISRVFFFFFFFWGERGGPAKNKKSFFK